MEIKLSVLETFLLVFIFLVAGLILALSLEGKLESGYIYFTFLMLSGGTLILKKSKRKKAEK